ncbi:hypothetical protein [Lactiplantibacillus paraxiangfangensis]|uniref:hypothetical protein n=1 Tax=Lactiplantibacillus paraxiangfangensis TaxID=3076224 RepID=UPI0030C71D2C
MNNAQIIFEGLNAQIQESRNLFVLEKLRNTIITASRWGKKEITWDKSKLDDDIINALLGEGICVIKRKSKNDYLLDWSEIYEEM